MTAEGTAIRVFTPEDIPFGMELKDIAGWNQLPADWERFVQWEPQGCFLATCDGKPAGTATTIRYQDRFGWIGMVLVHPDMRRRGLGTALLMACIEYLEACGVAAVKLDATPMGKQLYDTIGFVDEYLLERHSIDAPAPGDAECVEPITAEHLESLCALDLEAFGADRSRVLRTLHAAEGADALVVCSAGEVQGFIFSRPGRNARYVGPWVARDAEVAEALFCQALQNHAGGPAFVDISLANPATAQMVARYGFEKQRHLIRMVRGRNDHPGETSLVYGATGPEVG